MNTQQQQTKLINIFLFISCCAVLAGIFLNDLNIKITLLTTGQTRQYPNQQPYYGILPVPGTASPESYGALGADFAQVYFSALAIRHHDNEYTPRNPAYADPLGRRPNYPPLTNRLLIPLTLTNYSTALLIHNAASFILCAGLSAIVLAAFNLGAHIWKIWLLDILFYLYTPLGFAHFERGQFDLLTASAYLLIFSAVFSKRLRVLTCTGSGFLASLKWSSFPFMGTFCAIFLAASNRKTRWIAVLPLLIITLSIIIFPTEIKQYWPSLRRYEIMARPTGVTFMYLMPKLAAKSMQVISAALVMGLLLARTSKNPTLRADIFRAISLPFAMTMFIQGMCFGTISYEYRIVSMLGLIPGVLLWINQVNQINLHLKRLVTALVTIFMITAFRVFHFFIWQLPAWEASGMTIIYLCFSLLFLAISIIILIKNTPSPTTINAPPSAHRCHTPQNVSSL